MNIVNVVHKSFRSGFDLIFNLPSSNQSANAVLPYWRLHTLHRVIDYFNSLVQVIPEAVPMVGHGSPDTCTTQNTTLE